MRLRNPSPLSLKAQVISKCDKERNRNRTSLLRSMTIFAAGAPAGHLSGPSAAWRTAASPFDAVSRRCDRAAAVWPPFPSDEGLSSTASVEGAPSLLAASSVVFPRPTSHRRTCSSCGCCLQGKSQGSECLEMSRGPVRVAGERRSGRRLVLGQLHSARAVSQPAEPLCRRCVVRCRGSERRNSQVCRTYDFLPCRTLDAGAPDQRARSADQLEDS